MSSHRSEGVWLAPESPDLAWFGGEDAVRFLNDLISQEIGDMVVGEARRSFLLEPRGKLQFLLWVLKDDGRIGLVTDSGRGDELVRALGRYRIRVDVEISPSADNVWLVIGGWQGYDVSWPHVERHLVIGERPDLPMGDVDDYHALRIEAGEPAWGVDIDERTIPHESGLVPLAVDFTKGCFLGQELVARIDSRGGNVPRHLLRVRSNGGDLSAGDRLTVDGGEIGVITSAQGQVGLAMVKRVAGPGDVVSIADATATLEEVV